MLHGVAKKEKVKHYVFSKSEEREDSFLSSWGNISHRLLNQILIGRGSMNCFRKNIMDKSRGTAEIYSESSLVVCASGVMEGKLGEIETEGMPVHRMIPKPKLF